MRRSRAETLARFAREVAKYPPDQKQSAVMACLAIVQQDDGFISRRARKTKSPRTSAWPPIAVYEVTTFYNMYNQQPVGQASSSTSAPTCRASCATARPRSRTSARSSASPMGGTTRRRPFTVQQSECLGACADAPVMLVNDRRCAAS